MRTTALIEALPVTVVLLGLLVVGCEGCGAEAKTPTTPSPVAPPAAESNRGAEDVEPGADGPGQATIDGVVVRAVLNEDRGADLVIENHGDGPVALDSEIQVEARAGQGFALLDPASQVAMRGDCERPADGCVTLVPGAAFHPPAWLGTHGDGQCACERCRQVAPGTYRFVVRACEGVATARSEPFDIGP